MKRILLFVLIAALGILTIAVSTFSGVNAVGTPTENYTIPDLPTNDPSHDEIKPPVSFLLEGATTQVSSNSPAFVSKFIGTSAQNIYTIIGDATWDLNVDINMPGWLYIYEYYPPENSPQGRWLAYKWQLKQSGIWKLGPFKARDKEPEGQHVYRIWFYGDGQWAPAETDTQQNSLIYWTYLKSYPELKIQDFSISSKDIQHGDSVTLSWNVLGSNKIDISTIGEVAGPAGTKTVTPDVTTAFTLVATGLDGTQAQSGPLTVNVSASVPATAPPAVTPISPQPEKEKSFIDQILSPIPIISFLSVLVIIGLGFLLIRVYKKRWVGPMTASIPEIAAPNKTLAEEKPFAIKPFETVRARLALPDGIEVLLAGNNETIGRVALARTLGLDDLCRISHNHFQIAYDDGKYFIEDTTSANGTKLNNIDIKGKGPFALKDGDIIDLADTVELKFFINDL